MQDYQAGDFVKVETRRGYHVWLELKQKANEKNSLFYDEPQGFVARTLGVKFGYSSEILFNPDKLENRERIMEHLRLTKEVADIFRESV
jgi:DNA-binding transcriptional MocR family regulator